MDGGHCLKCIGGDLIKEVISQFRCEAGYFDAVCPGCGYPRNQHDEFISSGRTMVRELFSIFTSEAASCKRLVIMTAYLKYFGSRSASLNFIRRFRKAYEAMERFAKLK